MIDPHFYNRLVQEVSDGLPASRDAMAAADENQAFYDHDEKRYLPRREAQTEWDYDALQECSSGLLRQVSERLCEHLYNPGPNRQAADDPTADEFLSLFAEQVHLDLMLREAELLSTVNDVAALQVDPGEGDPDRPLELHLWARDEFQAWCDPNNSRRVVAVATADRYDQRCRYRLWTDATVQTFFTAPISEWGDRLKTAGGVASRPAGPPEDHGFGCVPFAFWHYKFPARTFWTVGHGTYLRNAQKTIDSRLTRLNESIDKHLNPLPVAEGVPAEWQPIIEAQRFIKLPSGPNPFGGMGDIPTPQARLYYLQATLAIQDSWHDLENRIKQTCEACGVPLSAVRMEQQGASSGIAIVAEQAPLLTRAKKRQNLAARYETELARVALTVAGNHYGRPELVASGASLKLLLTWPEPSIPIPGPDRDEATEFELKEGLTSRIMELMLRRGWTRDQAVAHIKQIAKDRADEEKYDPTPEPVAPVPVIPDPERQAVDRGQETQDQEDDES